MVRVSDKFQPRFRARRRRGHISGKAAVAVLWYVDCSSPSGSDEKLILENVLLRTKDSSSDIVIAMGVSFDLAGQAPRFLWRTSHLRRSK